MEPHDPLPRWHDVLLTNGIPAYLRHAFGSLFDDVRQRIMRSQQV
jgi:hypothetical protein